MRNAVRTILIAWAMYSGLSGTQSAFAQAAQPAAEADRARAERLVSEHTDARDIQSERPEFSPEFENLEPPKRNPIIEAIGDFFAWLFRTFGWVFQALLIATIAFGVLYALWYMFGDMIGFQRRKKAQAEGPEVSEVSDDRPDRKHAAALLDEADALAAQGRFAEAVHLLLFRSIEDLQSQRTGGVPASLTAREIQSLSDLAQRTRDALSPIIRVVENSFFGGHPVDRQGWQQARTSYETFAFGGQRA